MLRKNWRSEQFYKIKIKDQIIIVIVIVIVIVIEEKKIKVVELKNVDKNGWKA